MKTQLKLLETQLIYPHTMLNNVIHGDTTKLLPLFKSESIDMICTDPPYGTEQKGFGYDDSQKYVFKYYDFWVKQMARVLKPHCHLYLFVPTLLVDYWVAKVRKYLTYLNLVSLRCFVNNRFPIKNNFCFDAQYVIFASKGSSKNLNQVDWIPTSTTWLYDKRNTNPKLFTYLYPSFINDDIIHANTKANDQVKRYHPNEKNPLLIKRFIEMSTNKGDLVADFFCGSGNTLIASLDAGRKCIGIEKNKTYYEMIAQRIKDCKHRQEYLEKNTLKASLMRLAKKKTWEETVKELTKNKKGDNNGNQKSPSN